MRTKKPQPFNPNRQYNPGERAVYRDMVVVAERWVNPSKRIVEKFAKNFGTVLYRCGCCAIKREDCPPEGLKCHITNRTDRKTIFYRHLYYLKNKSDEKE